MRSDDLRFGMAAMVLVSATLLSQSAYAFSPATNQAIAHQHAVDAKAAELTTLARQAEAVGMRAGSVDGHKLAQLAQRVQYMAATASYANKAAPGDSDRDAWKIASTNYMMQLMAWSPTGSQLQQAMQGLSIGLEWAPDATFSSMGKEHSSGLYSNDHIILRDELLLEPAQGVEALAHEMAHAANDHGRLGRVAVDDAAAAASIANMGAFNLNTALTDHDLARIEAHAYVVGSQVSRELGLAIRPRPFTHFDNGAMRPFDQIVELYKQRDVH